MDVDFVGGEVLIAEVVGGAAASVVAVAVGVMSSRSLWYSKSISVHPCSMSARPRSRIVFLFSRQCGTVCLGDGQ